MKRIKKSNSQVKCLQDVFDLAGSSSKLAAQLDLHAFTVENWRRSGIPQKYWDRLHELYGITPAELYIVSKVARNKIVNPKKVL